MTHDRQALLLPRLPGAMIDVVNQLHDLGAQTQFDALEE